MQTKIKAYRKLVQVFGFGDFKCESGKLLKIGEFEWLGGRFEGKGNALLKVFFRQGLELGFLVVEEKNRESNTSFSEMTILESVVLQAIPEYPS